MYNFKIANIKLVSLLFGFVFLSNISMAQEFNLVNLESNITIYGTSSLHDWHEDVEAIKGTIHFNNMETCDIKSLNVNIEAESLKSGKRSMDKNTYEALKTDTFKTILFQFVEAKNPNQESIGKFNVPITGDLTIAGVKKRVTINFQIQNLDGKVQLKGEKNIKMTDFNVDPPKALFGTITTGDDITIKISTIFK